ncbi:MAG: DUF5666 domain-containing protein [Gammaproteobacteria bacterium]|nr:DUF5666 domain-containing protein [Gammaproteobacteria bacterium]MDH3805834.1 DUF5666 domain-containing protein [Gammaproteobacteria bacterium]
MNTYTKNFGALITLAALLLAGCGGSGGGGGNNGNNPPPPPPTGGITRTGVAAAVGPISGFGSIIVNGVEYETDATTSFIDDDQDIQETELKVGDMVLVKGSIEDDNTTASATSVEVEDTVEGPVTSVNAAAGNFVVLGQIVQVGPETSVDDNCPATLDGLMNNPPVAGVEVSGPYTVNAAGDTVIAATRFECKGILVEFEINGVVSGHNSVDKTFMVNDLEVNYATAGLIQDFPGGVINDDDPVEVTGTQFDDSVVPPVLTADKVEFKGNRLQADEGDHLEIEGFITRFVSATDFDIGDIPVTVTEITGTTVYEGGTAMDLGLHLKVEVEGEFDLDGVLNATKIEIKTSTAIRVTGLVDAPSSGDAFMILGITVNTAVLKTRFEDKSDIPDVPFGVGNITTGYYIEVRGQELPAGEITAFLVERDDARPETELRGFVEAGGENRPDLTVLGVTVQTVSGVTVFTDSRGDTEVEFATEDDFWAAVGEGSLIDVKGTETDTQILLAEEVELELE